MRKRNTGKALHAGTWLVSLFLALSVCMPAVPVMAEEAEEQPAVQEEIPDETEVSEETETVPETLDEEMTEEVSSEAEDVFSEPEETTAQQEEEPVPTEEKISEETVVLETEAVEEAAEADPADVSSWTALQETISNASSGETITLETDITASSDDTYLIVAEGKDVIINLNGHEISRNLQEGAEKGYVISVSGKLTVRDSRGAGKITGGNSSSDPMSDDAAGGILIRSSGEMVLEGGRITGNYGGSGGGILCRGKLTMTGGKIEGNTASVIGGGVEVSLGEMVFSGGSITGNNAGQFAGGIDFSNGVLRLSGSPYVKDNTVNGNTESNVLVFTDQVIEFAGALNQNAEIHVSSYILEKEGRAATITSGLPENGSIDNFYADRANTYAPGYTNEDEIMLAQARRFRFYDDVGYMSYDMPDVYRAVGSIYTIPECIFEMPEEETKYKGWKNRNGEPEYLQPGEKITVTVNMELQADWYNPWRDLQQAIYASDGKTPVKLTEDTIAGKKDTRIQIPGGKTVTIDLNGFMLNRNLKVYNYGGEAIVNNGTLTIMDSDEDQTGLITGGYTPENGGGILNYGELILNSGTITGNYADKGGGVYNTGSFTMNGGKISKNMGWDYGGGIYQASGSVVMTGGEISGNSTWKHGGGVYCNTISLSGRVRIENNNNKNGPDNLFLTSGGIITIGRIFGESSRIGVEVEKVPSIGERTVITEGLSGKGSLSNFFSDVAERLLFLNEDGEVEIAAAAIFTFESGDEAASGTMEAEKVEYGEIYPIPQCGFTVEGKTFNGWMVNNDPGNIAVPGKKITAQGNMKLTATWEASWAGLQKQIDESQPGDVIVLQDDVNAAIEDVPLYVARGKNLTIDLNGHTINRNLEREAENGGVFIIRGDLTITDTDADQTGMITGGSSSSSGPDLSGTIYVREGSFTLEAGTISGNYSHTGGALAVADGTITINGGKIQNNTAEDCSAVMLYTGSELNLNGGEISANSSNSGAAVIFTEAAMRISGSPVISGNTSNNKEANVLIDRERIYVKGVLSETAKIGITLSDGSSPVIVTRGLNGKGTAENFASDSGMENVSLNEDGEAVLGPLTEPVFRGHQLVLTGSLGLKFGVKFPADFDSTGSYMTFMLNGEEQRVNTSQADVLEDGRRAYTCYVNTLQMAEKIEVVFHYGENQTIEDEYSLVDYFSYFDEHESEYGKSTLNLVHAVADYGYYAYPYLVKLHKLGDKYAEITKHYAESFDYDAIRSEVSRYQFTKMISSSEITRASYKLSLDSETALSIYMEVPAGTELTAEAVFGGRTFRAEKQSEGVYVLKVTGIRANQLDSLFVVSGNAGGEFAMTVTGLSYIRSILNNSSYGTDAKNTVSALYKYYEAVRSY